MKQIFRNKYLKVLSFYSLKEQKVFLGNQVTKNILSIDETFGDNHFCYVCYDSLSGAVQFILAFSSDENTSNLNFLFWDNHNICVLDTGRCTYLIEENLSILNSFETITPLIGFHLLNSDTLLLLEEAYFRVINSKGRILKDKSFDLISNFKIEDEKLYIQTYEEGAYSFPLI